MFHVDLAAVHEVDERLHVLEPTVAHQNDRILAVHVAVAEDRIEVGAARAQDDPVGAQRLALARDRHVAEAAAVEQLREHRLQIAVVILPAQAVLLRRHRGKGAGNRLWRCVCARTERSE